jgi:hypothetical protein
MPAHDLCRGSGTVLLRRGGQDSEPWSKVRLREALNGPSCAAEPTAKHRMVELRHRSVRACHPTLALTDRSQIQLFLPLSQHRFFYPLMPGRIQARILFQ